MVFGAEEGHVGSGVMRLDRQVGPEWGGPYGWFRRNRGKF